MYDINKEIDNLADVLTVIVLKDRHYRDVKEFVNNCGNAEIQREWNSMTDKEQRSVADELYHYFCK